MHVNDMHLKMQVADFNVASMVVHTLQGFSLNIVPQWQLPNQSIKIRLLGLASIKYIQTNRRMNYNLMFGMYWFDEL